MRTPDLVDLPDTRPVSGTFVGVVNALQERDFALVALDDLDMLLPSRAPRSTARALRERGGCSGIWTRGVWAPRPRVRPTQPHVSA